MNKTFEELQNASWKHAEKQGFHASRAGIPEHMRRIVVCGLIHTEISEAIEAARTGDHNNYMEELADAVIRIMDEAEYIERSDGYDKKSLIEWIEHKQNINRSRGHMHGKDA